MPEYATRITLPLACSALLLAACATTVDRVDDGPPEDRPDLGMTHDSGVPEDAGARLDAGMPDQGPPDAGPMCEPGAMRSVDCGNCGLRAEECSAVGVWEAASECLAEGPCAPGALEERTRDDCAVENRVCNAECGWSEWTAVTEPGECTVGDERENTEGCADELTRQETCTDECVWDDSARCLDECGDVPRDTPRLSAEICVPAGDFVRGKTRADCGACGPQATVMLSAYYIDRFPVTNDRYRECVDAGACTVSTVGVSLLDYNDLTRGDHPVHGLSHGQAEDFCDWDGGRRLPTDAELAKAARGPSPRDGDFPWDAGDDCTPIRMRSCGFTPPVGEEGRTTDAVDAFPLSSSYYGAELMFGGVLERASDWYAIRYYSTAASRLPDPQGPAAPDSPGFRAVRGLDRQSLQREIFTNLWGSRTLRAAEGSGIAPLVGVRCARTP